MTSDDSLYFLTVHHERFFPVRHSFNYDLFMFYFDLDKLQELDKHSGLIGYNRHKLYSFFDSDHLQADNDSTKTKVIRFLQQEGHDIVPKRIMLLTNLRIFNYVFNPVSFYFCFDENNTSLGVIAEVTNTFYEKKGYFIPPQRSESGDISFKDRQKKLFYISPYSPLDLELSFDLNLPGEKASFRINDYDGDKCVFKSSLLGRRVALSDKTLLWLTISKPMMTLQIIFLIHIHALILFFKKAPFFSKECQPEKQTKVINPNASLRKAYIVKEVDSP